MFLIAVTWRVITDIVQWIQQHDDIGKKAGKPVVLEEYGTPFPHNHIATMSPWQTAVLESQLAADQNWQFGPAGISLARSSVSDEYTIWFDDAEYKTLGVEHAKEMLEKHV